jgi:hypothetical protein
MGEYSYSATILDVGSSGQLPVPAAVPRKRAPTTHWIGGWLGPRADLDAVEKQKVLPLPGHETWPLRP